MFDKILCYYIVNIKIIFGKHCIPKCFNDVNIGTKNDWENLYIYLKISCKYLNHISDNIIVIKITSKYLRNISD